jgi:hypothetical protein
MKKLEFEKIIILFFWLNIIISLILYFTLPINFIFGIIGLLFTTFLYFTKNKYSQLSLLFILFFGLISLMSFNAYFDINLMGFVNVPILIILPIFLYKRWDFFEDEFLSKSAEGYKKEAESNINFFLKKFENLSKEELEEKKSNKELTIEARKAAEMILITKINN